MNLNDYYMEKNSMTPHRKKQLRAALKGVAIDIPLSAAGAYLGGKVGRRFGRVGLGTHLGGYLATPIVTAVELRELEKHK